LGELFYYLLEAGKNANKNKIHSARLVNPFTMYGDSILLVLKRVNNERYKSRPGHIEAQNNPEIRRFV